MANVKRRILEHYILNCRTADGMSDTVKETNTLGDDEYDDHDDEGDKEIGS